ncbi:putative integral membrane protein conserved region-domain-containing protein, partial [Zopfochytrium polystomum]
WLNALVGRAFIGLHSNPKIKEWVIAKINSRVSKSRETSILGDIVIQDLSVGDSLPVISNPRLVDFSVDGDLNVQFDVDYTGGFRIEAATIATVSVTAWEKYIKPITLPLVVAIKVKKFSARVLIKAKPLWESSRLWVGLHRDDPPLQIELEVEPIISNKMLKLHIVNQIVERRIRAALDEFLVLPNMDDIGFWFDRRGGLFWDSDDESE